MHTACLLFGFLSFLQTQSLRSSTDTLVIFTPSDSSYLKHMISFETPSDHETITTTSFIPANKPIAALSILSTIVDSSDFRDFLPIVDGDEIQYPLSAVVKLFRIHGDTLTSRCSGLMVSPRHVLTAVHCLFLNHTDMIRDIYAYPGYHKNGLNLPHQVIKTSKYYFTNDVIERSSLANDIALLELEEAVGNDTGWLGIGYINPDSAFVIDKTFHSFGFPADTHLVDSTTFYDGETMVHGYGFVTKTETHLTIPVNAIRGQSGSSILWSPDDQVYTTFGVVSYTQLYPSSVTNYQVLNMTTFGAFAQAIEATMNPIKLPEEQASSFILFQNYPNPFNPTTTIAFQLESSGTVQLKVFDITGRIITTIVDHQWLSQGTHQYQFNAEILSSGVYFYQLIANGRSMVKKFTVLK